MRARLAGRGYFHHLLVCHGISAPLVGVDDPVPAFPRPPPPPPTQPPPPPPPPPAAAMTTSGLVQRITCLELAQTASKLLVRYLPWAPQVSSSPVSLVAANIAMGRYAYTQDLMGLDGCTDETGPVSWPTSPSPVHLSNWMKFVLAHPDHSFASYIHSGLSTGFRISFNRPQPRSEQSPICFRENGGGTEVHKG